MKITIAFALIFAILVAGFGVFLAKDRIEVLANSDAYVATVIECEWKRTRSASRNRTGRYTNSYAPVAVSEEGYRAIGGLKVASRKFCEKMIGQEVTILVDRNDSEKTRIKSFFQFWFAPFLLLVAIAFGVACVFQNKLIATVIFCGAFLFGGGAAAIEFRIFRNPPEQPNLQPVDGKKALQVCIDEAMRQENTQQPDQLKRLTCTKRYLTDLSLLEQLSSLEELDLSSNQIKSLKPLGSLLQLRMLTLDGSRALETLNGLQGLSRLESLKVHCAELVEIDAVKDLKSLRHLDVSCNKFSNLSPITNLNKLEKLIMDDNPNVTSIVPVANKTELEVITMYRVPISDISPLFGNSKLRSVNIGNTTKVTCQQIYELRSGLMKSAQIRGPKACAKK